ncbi:isoleucine--tRNA ligase [Candidatus Kaiserbacteria bacterium]|nr:isoleucine--tRNA ligase [Candidatus Kaiserbacteria bacterium]
MAEKPQKPASPVGSGKARSDTALREEETLKFWEENDIFKKSVKKDAPNGEYVFYDGPPFATGLPHYGHIVASVIKDVVPRFWTMRGYSVPRVWGWDCHGLPIENIVEKELGFKHKKDIIQYGIDKFNETCRARVLTYAEEWEKIIPRIGRWADMEHAYRTMDKPFMESVWWVFKQIYDKGLVYEDYRSMHICPRCETTLSQQEVSEGYKDVKDIAVRVKFRVKNPEKHGLPENTYFLAWTTTPWTLPGNVALAVNAGETYRAFKWAGENYIDIKRSGYKYPGHDFKEFLGKDLVGIEYEPPFDYYIKDTTLKNHENGWKVYAADFVTAESGTGIAHEAPAFGADDWELLKKVNLPFVQHVNMDGTMKSEVKDFAGMEVKPRSEDDKVRLGTDIAVLKYLQQHELLHTDGKENITHSYPHCWRCDTPLLNYATSSWFVSVTKIKENLLKNAEVVNWSPEHIKEGRFGKWLEGARDWSISRQRFWASVIPIWRCEACKKQRVFGSAAELEEASGKKVDDLHKHIVDAITVPCLPSEALAKEGECGGTMRRIPDVLDTWFDSGSMPYGEKHYPFDPSSTSEQSSADYGAGNKELPLPRGFPAKFIAEGLDQTRAWFYYLHVLGGALFQKNAFQNVIVNGIVLAEDGKKMSKKLQNYPDPMDVVEKYGADALRLYLLSSPVMQAENFSFSESGVDEIVKKNIGRLGNVLAFYQLYANDTVRDWKSENILDRWIVARLDEFVIETTSGYENYQLDSATRPLPKFIDDLSVWYLRRSRDRFKEEGKDKNDALATLRYVLHRLSLVMAPAMPFFAEHLFQSVREGEDEESVHLATWPEVSVRTGFLARIFGGANKDKQLLDAMQTARAIVTKALEARDAAKIKVRQPLASLSIPRSSKLPDEYLSIVADEVNVRKVERTGDGVALDTNITQELREEGLVRDTIREIQAYRKAQNMKPGESTTYKLTTSPESKVVLEKHLAGIQKATSTIVEFT